MDENTSPPSGTDSGTGDGGARERFGRARDYVEDTFESASGRVRDGYNSVREKVEDVDFDELAGQVRTYVRSNPGKALLISVGVGFLVGLMLRRDDEE